ncbi:DUF2268 domain-containing protein [Fictibacillus phosphorivorans]|uniref:DUF2268 domain-containing protein n=1 Tax=Fictibacillus phosphorivorans TaxID=1221500 RepID=UPI003CEB6D22
MQGVTGWTLSENAILIQIDPSFSENALKYTIAHEYHHTKNFESTTDLNFTLIDKFIFEGKADNFATIIYPHHKTAWTEPLSEIDLNHVLTQLSADSSSLDPYLYQEYFEGNPVKNIPKWSNYKVGYAMTKSFIENHSQLSIEEWTKLGTKEIIQKSNYLRKFR